MSELTYERAKQLYTPYDEGQMRHLCALRDVEIDRLRDENAKLRKLVTLMYRDMQGVLDTRTDTVWVNDFCTLRDGMDYHMQAMAELGMPPADYERRMRELGIEVEG